MKIKCYYWRSRVGKRVVFKYRTQNANVPSGLVEKLRAMLPEDVIGSIKLLRVSMTTFGRGVGLSEAADFVQKLK